MAYYRSKRGAIWGESETAFGAGGAGSPTYLKTKEFSAPIGLEYAPGDDITQKDVEDIGSILYKPGELTLKMGMHPQQSAWPTGAPVEGENNPIVGLLEGVLGTVFDGGYGVTHTTGNSTTVLAFPTGEGVDTPTEMGFVPGEFVFVRNANGTNIVGANVVKTVDDVLNKVTLRSPLPAIPGSQAIVYGGYTVAKLPMTTVPSYEFIVSGEGAFDHQHLFGCCCKSLSIEAPHGGLATLSATYSCAAPTPPVAGENGGAPDNQTYSYPETPQVLFGGLYLHDATGAGTTYKLEGGVNIDLGVELQPVEGVHGVDPNGIAGYCLTARTIRVKLQPAYTSNALYALFASPPSAGLTVTGWWGRGAQVWAFQIPNAILVSPPKKADKNGISMLEVEFGCAAYAGDTGTFDDADAGNKPFCIGVLAGAVSA